MALCVCVCVCVYVCVCVCMCVCVCVCVLAYNCVVLFPSCVMMRMYKMCICMMCVHVRVCMCGSGSLVLNMFISWLCVCVMKCLVWARDSQNIWVVRTALSGLLSQEIILH